LRSDVVKSPAGRATTVIPTTARSRILFSFSFACRKGRSHAFTLPAPLFGTQQGITVNPAAASQLVVAGFPATGTAGVTHTFTLTALDPNGNVATGFRDFVRFTGSDHQAVLPADYTFDATWTINVT
jgi:hypothetical protein